MAIDRGCVDRAGRRPRTAAIRARSHELAASSTWRAAAATTLGRSSRHGGVSSPARLRVPTRRGARSRARLRISSTVPVGSVCRRARRWRWRSCSPCADLGAPRLAARRSTVSARLALGGRGRGDRRTGRAHGPTRSALRARRPRAPHRLSIVRDRTGSDRARPRGARRALRASAHARRQRLRRLAAPSAKRLPPGSGSRPPRRDARSGRRRRPRVTSSPRTHACSQTADALAAGDLAVLGPLLRRVTPASATTTTCRHPSSTCSSSSSSTTAPPPRRLTGAGFGGCVVTLVHRPRARRCRASVTRYSGHDRARGQCIRRHAVDGATSVRGVAPSSARTPPH